jgi:hypothetical protein
MLMLLLLMASAGMRGLLFLLLILAVILIVTGCGIALYTMYYQRKDRSALIDEKMENESLHNEAS